MTEIHCQLTEKCTNNTLRVLITTFVSVDDLKENNWMHFYR